LIGAAPAVHRPKSKRRIRSGVEPTLRVESKISEISYAVRLGYGRLLYRQEFWAKIGLALDEIPEAFETDEGL